MQDKRREAGQKAEQQARSFLLSRGLEIRHSNYRCRGGEIDLVCRDGATLVFVEVRLRSNPRFGGALASVTAQKQRRLVHAASHYLARSGWPGACRFDVVGLDGAGRTTWVRDAFQAA
jgi:putative endonuclease